MLIAGLTKEAGQVVATQPITNKPNACGTNPKNFQIRGEIIIEKNDFLKMNEIRLNQGLDPYMNPRNTASGSLKLQDSSEVAKRPLKCFLYQIVSNEENYKTQQTHHH